LRDTKNDNYDGCRCKMVKFSVTGHLTLARAIRPGTDPLFREISSDRQRDHALINAIASTAFDVRMSKPGRPGVILASVAVALHFGHGGL
jgi:hypothetical protein